jgi:hypothetical protein
MNDKSHPSAFTEPSSWQKLTTASRTPGGELVKKALSMVRTTLNKYTPVCGKSTLLGALGVCACQTDGISDALTAVGYPVNGFLKR